MRSTCSELAADVLDRCVAGAPPRELPPELAEEPCAKALFGVLVEGLADRFEPPLCSAYARLFAQVVARVRPEERAEVLVAPTRSGAALLNFNPGAKRRAISRAEHGQRIASLYDPGPARQASVACTGLRGPPLRRADRRR